MTLHLKIVRLESIFQVSDVHSVTNYLGYGGYVPGVKSENVFG
jgi:hypothetical protein